MRLPILAASVLRRRGNSAEALAYLAAVITAGGTVSPARLNLISALTRKLQNGGVWSKLDRIWVFAAENAPSALVCLKSGIAATAVAAPTLEVDRGYTGNGTTSYVNTGFLPSDGVQLTLNAMHASAYIRTSRTAANASAIFGALSNTPSSHEITVYPRFTGNVIHMRAGDGATAGPDQTNAQGLWLINRSSSTTKEWYKNGVSFHAAGAPVIGRPAFAVYVGARNSAGTAASFSTDQFSALTLGGHLTATEALAHKNAIEEYMDAIGAGVL